MNSGSFLCQEARLRFRRSHFKIMAPSSVVPSLTASLKAKISMPVL